MCRKGKGVGSERLVWRARGGTSCVESGRASRVSQGDLHVGWVGSTASSPRSAREHPWPFWFPGAPRMVGHSTLWTLRTWCGLSPHCRFISSRAPDGPPGWERLAPYVCLLSSANQARRGGGTCMWQGRPVPRALRAVTPTRHGGGGGGDASAHVAPRPAPRPSSTEMFVR